MNTCLHFGRIPQAQCSGMATSGAGFLLPMETASCSAHPCPDSPNPPSAVTLKSLPALLSARISPQQIFRRGCFAGAGAVSQGGWWGPTPQRRRWQGQTGGMVWPQSLCGVGGHCSSPSPSHVGETWLCSCRLQHPDLCCQQETFKTSVGVTPSGGNDPLVTGSVVGGGEMWVLLRKEQTAFLLKRGSLEGMGSLAPCQVQQVQVLRSHRLLLRDNDFAVKWSDSCILSSPIFFKTHQKTKSSIYTASQVMDGGLSRKCILWTQQAIEETLVPPQCSVQIQAHAWVTLMFAWAFISTSIFTWCVGQELFWQCC